MSPLGNASILFDLFQSGRTVDNRQSPTSSVDTSLSNREAFSSLLTVCMASLQAQSVDSLLGSVLTDGKVSSHFDSPDGMGDVTRGVSATQGLLVRGRNLSLFDPESAYRMMSVINYKDVVYKAQFSELTQMKDGVIAMQQAGQQVGCVSESMDNETIKTRLKDFAAKYNEWVNRFDPAVKNRGALVGVQAAEVSLYELEQSVENIFNGAKDGLHGLGDLGFTIDKATNLALIDTAKLEATLATNRNGVINTINEFSANFTKSAELLNSTNNFIPNRLANLDRAIDYIANNEPSLQAEFGLGDPAKPSLQIAQTLRIENR